MALTLIHERTQAPIADDVEMAMTRAARRRGLLGRDRLDAGSALILSPCLAVHTAFMRFPIDVAFVDGDGYAVQVVHALKPWRMAISPRARAVVELPAGRLETCGVVPGDRLVIVRTGGSAEQDPPYVVAGQDAPYGVNPP